MAIDPLSPLYTSVDSVKIRLAGKVAFQSGAEPTNREMPDDLLAQLIVDAETAVEQDLRGRYAIPFRSVDIPSPFTKGTWKKLPDHTQRAIRSIVDCKAVIFILQSSFGSGTHITGDGYIKSQQEMYSDLLRRLLGQDMEANEFGEKRFRRTPPLDGLMLSPTNIADDGLRGMVIDANSRGPYQSGVEYAASRVNDPSIGVFYGGRRGPRGI